jgi:hypothetical protein
MTNPRATVQHVIAFVEMRFTVLLHPVLKLLKVMRIQAKFWADGIVPYRPLTQQET